jgi:hypothetical protein
MYDNSDYIFIFFLDAVDETEGVGKPDGNLFFLPAVVEAVDTASRECFHDFELAGTSQCCALMSRDFKPGD